MTQSTDLRLHVTANWDVAAYWVLGVTPGSASPADPAEFYGATAYYTTTVTDTESAGAVTLDDGFATLTIATGGELLVGSGTSLGLNLDAGTLTLAGTIASGSGSALTITESGATTNYDGGTLSDVVIKGTLDLSAANAALISTGGLAVDNATSGDQGQITLTGNDARLTFASTTTLADVALTIGGTTDATVTVGSGSTLTLDSASSVQLSNSEATFNGAGTLVLDGSISVEASGETTVEAQALVLATASVQNNGTITIGGGYAAGTLTVTGALTGTGSVVVYQLDDYAVTIEFGSTVASTQTIDVTNGQGSVTTLILDGVTAAAPNAVAGKITGLGGFGTNDVIDLTKIAYSSALTASIASGVLTIKNGSVVDAVLNTDLVAGDAVYFAKDSNGTGTDVTVVACFCPGTLIRTPRGDIAVEALRIGDPVTTATGSAEPVRWIGRRSYAGRLLAGRPHLLPVRIRAGALGAGLPLRDLVVSPKHAMLLDGVLVAAEYLVNGSTIVREARLERVDYIHVELDRHDIILAEGAPTESFVDDDSRGMFQNASEWAALYPGRGWQPAIYCAPRVEGGHALEAIRRRICGVLAA